MLSRTGRYARGVTVRPGCYRLLDQRRRGFHASRRTSTDNASSSLADLDRKWRDKWQEAGAKKNTQKQRTSWQTENLAVEKKKKMYILPMFPYPSGSLHMGHFRVYTISDVLSRFRRMQGYDVMHPIGWDAFGLPAENAARDRGFHPKEWTKRNIQEMWRQLEVMNGHWDTEREFATCDSTFYKHTQRLFLLLYERGLAYQAEAMVNYDPVDKTVLANEQVDANGRSWRSGAVVEKKMLRQWFFKISEFRQQLLDDLDHLSRDGAWPERVLTMQRNWLGKSTGARVKFKVEASEKDPLSDIEVFTTRPDTLLGAQYLALSATHPLVQKLAKTNKELKLLTEDMHLLSPDSKLGYQLPNIRAYNPLANEESSPEATRVSIPVYVAPYVLGDYGGGAVMGVPGHDSRDYAFWKQNCPEKSIRTVIQPSRKVAGESNSVPFIGKGILTPGNGAFAGLSSEQASKKILNFLESKDLGSSAESWRLRDWLVSRQRYWGTPIPIIHCGSCGPVAVPEDQLPVELPKGQIDWTKSNGNELFNDFEWLNTSCPKCGGHAKRETDTMDTFVDSSWYFMRFPDAKNNTLPFSADSANTNLPVDLYIGGVEHAILHLLYARFISKFLATTELWPAGAAPDVLGEPFKKVLTQGMVHGKTYTDPSTGRFLKPDEVDLQNPAVPVVKSTGATAKISFEKMSKSKYNGVDPTACVERYGADVTRAHMLFSAPVSDVLEWDEEKIAGVRRWISKVFEFVATKSDLWAHAGVSKPNNVLPNFIAATEFIDSPRTQIYLRNKDAFHIQYLDDNFRTAQLPPDVKNVTAEVKSELQRYLEPDKKMWRQVQSTITSVTEAYGKTHSLNTVVSDLMSLTNSIIDYHDNSITKADVERRDHLLSKIGLRPLGSCAVSFRAVQILIKLMAPITPAVAEELWQHLHAPSVPLSEKIKFQSDVSSVFDQPFPEPDGSYHLLAPTTRTCAVQVNGKLKCAVEIPLASEGLKGVELEKWVTGEILQTREGKEKLMGGGGDLVKGTMTAGRPDIRKARKVIVVKGGKTVNYVV